MISVDPETYDALQMPTVTVTPRLRLLLDGGDVNLTPRLLEDPMIQARVGPWLDMARDGGQTFTIADTDKMLTPADVEGSLLRGKKPSDWFLSDVIYDIGIRRADGTDEYVPVYTGVLTDLSCPQVGVVSMETASRWGFGMETEMAMERVLNGSNAIDWGPTVIQTIYNLTNEIAWPASPFTDSSWSAVDGMMKQLDWHLVGRIRQGTPVSSGAHLLASSCGCQITPLETGLLRISPVMFPAECGAGGYAPWMVPGVISEKNANGWRMTRPIDLAATEIIVRYQSTSVRWRNKDNEGGSGCLARTMTLPYIAFGRQAALIARIAYEQHGNAPMVVNFVMGPAGLLYQLNDWVLIEDPFTNSQNWFRITAKQVRFGSVGFEAVQDGHLASVIQEGFVIWGTTAWSDTTRYWL